MHLLVGILLAVATTLAALGSASIPSSVASSPTQETPQSSTNGEDKAGGMVYPEMPAGAPTPAANPDAEAESEEAMKPYTETLTGTEVQFKMTPIPGGSFQRGSPPQEQDRKESEGPVTEVTLSPFWMGVHEVTWDEYHIFMMKLDLERRAQTGSAPVAQDAWADAVSRPTPPYVPMDFEMGVNGYPAISMTQFAARQYTKWLSMKTGRFYRLPTAAEWEYACRAGTTTAYFFGDDPDDLEEYAWYFDNADDQYQPVGLKKPNPWGLYDIHGNVNEWVMDQYLPTFYADSSADSERLNPISWPTTLYPREVRGGSWDDDPDRLRSAARRGSTENWKVDDPQLPKSIWYLTNAKHLGFRVVRPLETPSLEDQARFWETTLEDVREIQEKQRSGGR